MEDEHTILSYENRQRAPHKCCCQPCNVCGTTLVKEYFSGTMLRYTYINIYERFVVMCVYRRYSFIFRFPGLAFTQVV